MSGLCQTFFVLDRRRLGPLTEAMAGKRGKSLVRPAWLQALAAFGFGGDDADLAGEGVVVGGGFDRDLAARLEVGGGAVLAAVHADGLAVGQPSLPLDVKDR